MLEIYTNKNVRREIVKYKVLESRNIYYTYKDIWKWEMEERMLREFEDHPWMHTFDCLL